MTEAEAGATCLQAKEPHQLWQPEKVEEAGTDPPWGSQKERSHAAALVSDLQPLDLRENTCLV